MYVSIQEKENSLLTPEEAKVEEALKDEDTDFIQRLRRQHQHISDEEFSELLKKHLEDTDRIKRQRQGEKDKMEEKLNRRLQGRKGRTEGEPEEEEENGEVSLEEDWSVGTSVEKMDEETKKVR